MSKKINEIAPREIIGGETGKRYDFQYAAAATHCLELLEDDGCDFIFCEWHDDYVLEKKDRKSGISLYAFHQVKTKKNGLWELEEVFGIPKRITKKTVADLTSIMGRLLDHHHRFDDACDEVVLLTNAPVSPELRGFFDFLETITTRLELTTPFDTQFKKIFTCYGRAIKALNEDDLLKFLKKVTLLADFARLDKFETDLLGELTLKIPKLSEVEILSSDALLIAKELVYLIKQKSKSDLKKEPVPDQVLRDKRGVSPKEVLGLLSLSPQAFEALRKGEQINVIRSLSRLQRLGEKSGISKELVEDMCRYKVEWDLWWNANRHNSVDIEYSSLRSKCLYALKMHADRVLSFNDLIREAKAIAVSFSGNLVPGEILKPEIVLGCIFSLAAEQEWKDAKP